MTYAYFPGCSLKGTGKAYEESFLAVFEKLGVEVEEIDDWNCCGATAYAAINEVAAFTLSSRVLAKAEAKQREVVAPCAACYLVLNKTNKTLEANPHVAEAVQAALEPAGYSYSMGAKVRHPLEILAKPEMLKTIKGQVEKKLKGLNVACYYGCQIIRPYAEFDDQHDPISMDEIMKACGAKTVAFSQKTRCCGGSHLATMPEIGQEMCASLLREMKRQGADLCVTACPLCQFNLEAYQDQICAKHPNEDLKLPVLFFTQLVGLALGLPPNAVGLKHQIVKAEPILESKGLLGGALAAKA